MSNSSSNKNINDDNSVTLNIYDPQYKSLSSEENKIKQNDNGNGNGNETTELEEQNELNYELSDEEENEWKEYHENILVDWADKAMCYRWLHSKSCNKYTFLRNLYTIPVIILSTLTGTANFALQRVPNEYQGYAQIGIGSLNIIAGIITTISQFLKINELCESHRVSSISWDKFYRNIRVELVKSPNDRTNVSYLIKSCKDEFDRLMETSPIIDCYSKKMKLLGKAGSGQLAKMVNQICIAGLVQGLSEGINFGMKAGLNMEDVIEVISKGAAQSWQMENRYKTMIDDKFDFGFAVDWMRKDLKIAMDEAKNNGSSLPITEIVDKYYGEVQGLGGNRWDTSSLIKRFRK